MAAHGLGLTATGGGEALLPPRKHVRVYSEAEAHAMYGEGLAHGGVHASNSRSAGTLSLRRLVSTELCTFFAQLPWDINIFNAQPVDVVVFVARVWVPKHGRTVMNDGQVYPAASNLRGTFPALMYLFDRQGRSGNNNPCRSTFVDDYQRGLEKGKAVKHLFGGWRDGSRDRRQPVVELDWRRH